MSKKNRGNDPKRPRREGETSAPHSSSSKGGGGAAAASHSSSSSGGGGAAAASHGSYGEGFFDGFTEEELGLVSNHKLNSSQLKDNLLLWMTRPPTGLSGAQGDHVTAYSLIKRAISNIFSGIQERQNDISDKWFRGNRRKVTDFIQKLTLLDSSKESIDTLLNVINVVMNRYDQLRSRKTGMRIFRDRLLSDSEKVRHKEVTVKNIISILNLLNSGIQPPLSHELKMDLFSKIFSSTLIVGIKKDKHRQLAEKLKDKLEGKTREEYVPLIYETLKEVGLDDESLLKSFLEGDKIKNAKLIEEACRSLTIHTLRFFNKIPDGAFHRLKNDGKKKKMTESKALNLLDQSNPDIDNETLIDVINALIDYKQVGEESAEPGRRNNDIGKLKNIVGRHLYLIFSAYPEAGGKFNIYKYSPDDKKDRESLKNLGLNIITPFLNKFLEENWPMIPSESEKTRPQYRNEVADEIIKIFRSLVDNSVAQPSLSKAGGYLSSSASESDDGDQVEEMGQSSGGEEKERRKLVKQGISIFVNSTYKEGKEDPETVKKLNLGAEKKGARIVECKALIAKLEAEIKRLEAPPTPLESEDLPQGPSQHR